MEVILNQDIDRIGKAGSVVKVKDGFARNFLLPNGLAVPATSASLKKLEQEKQTKALHLEKIKKEAEEFKAQLDKLSLTIPVLTHEGEKLYAGITALDLANALKDEGLIINKDFFLLDEPIKSLGIYEVPVKLHPQVLAKIKVWIVKK
ncbi:MAG: 50S ribosomal protein L9 [Candidatus Omnitrophica bacterium]|nr:50S ribosomal protein L9 [Candidatus Omnitrophota bacterium]MDD5592958.1 50S ribosomal protein L9 [Candidatus Omnitrophota bacterium]